MTTNAYAAKRALFAALSRLAADQRGPLAGWQVAYAFPGDVQQRCVYGGRVTFDQPADGELEDGDDRVVQETAHVWLHLRVSVPLAQLKHRDGIPLGVEDTDETAEACGEQIGRLLSMEPDLCGGMSVSRVAAGSGDYSTTDGTATTVLSYQIDVTSQLDPRG